jgi:hypothetical protein
MAMKMAKAIIFVAANNGVKISMKIARSAINMRAGA